MFIPNVATSVIFNVPYIAHYVITKLTVRQPRSQCSLSCFKKEPWLRLVTRLPKSGSQK